jgi:hypothetical protein
MDCLHLPAGATAHHIDQGRQMLGVDAGLIAITDPALVDDLLTAHTAVLDGGTTLGPTGFACTPDGLVCYTRGDGAHPFTVWTHHDTTHAIQIDFDNHDDTRDRWAPAGLIPAPTGRLLVGDPSLLTHYVDDPFSPPFQAYGVWTVLTLPAPGWAAIHILKPNGAITGSNLAVLAHWRQTRLDLGVAQFAE